MSTTQNISKESILKISRILESQHVIFYKLWDMGSPNLSEEIPTACVKFDKSGSLLSFDFNPKFWDSLTDYERAFVIAHECLHVILNHGSRNPSKNHAEHLVANIAMDVAVNEMLLNSFKFDLDKIKNCPNICLCDTVFEEEIPNDRSFEYYLGKLKQTSNISMSTLDIHDFLSNVDQKALDQIIESITQDPSISQDEIEEFLDHIEKDSGGEGSSQESPGSISGKIRKSITNKKVKTNKKNWLELVSNLSKSILKHNIKVDEQWLLKPRRLSSIKTDFFLPFEHEEIHYENDKFNAWFFLDCSGSCYSYANEFFNATKAVPSEHFETRMFSFDTNVKEIDKNAKDLYGFGGTSFSCIENYIQSQIRDKNVKYPDLVFILTDGYGNNVDPKFPKKWVWINITDFNTYIPRKSRIIRYQDLYF